MSAIRLEAGLPRQKKIVICHAYKEWKYLGQEDGSSGSVAAQMLRWSALLNMWGKALLASDSTRQLKPLVELLFTKIFPHCVIQLVTVPTRVWPGQPDAALDHLYSNKPHKLSEVYTEFSGGSDHKLIKVTRFAKSMKKSVRYVRKRTFKNFNEAEFSSGPL